jgi:predicted enzyme related to lactoylglutathione lyase
MTVSNLDRPAWVDLSTSDPAGARAFYSAVLGWEVEVEADPLYGGYAMARVDGHDVAGIGPAQPGAPTAWSLYLGTDDATALGLRVAAAGGTVVLPAMQVGDVGTMAVFQDPGGAFISAWQPDTMPGFYTGVPGAYQYAELNSRGLDAALAFYQDVFGWTTEQVPLPDGSVYTRLRQGGEPIGGALPVHPMVPAEVPSYWMIYFASEDVDAAFARVLAGGGSAMVPPMSFPGGRFAIVRDPQGAFFALHQYAS